MRSKKRSAASSSSTPPERPILFLDRSLGRRVVADALRDAGAAIEVHAEHFAHDAPDTAWLNEVSKRGWIALTKDARIRYRPNELAAIRDSRARVVVLTTANLTGEQMAEIFVAALERIERIATATGPALFLLNRGRRLTRVRL